MTNFDPAIFDSSIFSVPSVSSQETAPPSRRARVVKKRHMAYGARMKMIEKMLDDRKHE